MIITQHAHIYSFHTSKFNFGEIFFLIFLSIQPLVQDFFHPTEQLAKPAPMESLDPALEVLGHLYHSRGHGDRVCSNAHPARFVPGSARRCCVPPLEARGGIGPTLTRSDHRPPRPLPDALRRNPFTHCSNRGQLAHGRLAHGRHPRCWAPPHHPESPIAGPSPRR